MAVAAWLFASVAVSLTEAAPREIELPFVFRAGLLWVEVSLPPAAAPLHFLVDTGAGVSAIDLGTARRLGVRLRRAVTIRGVGCQTTGYWSQRLTVRVGGISLRQSLVAVDLGALGKECPCPVDGLLGADFFRHRVVQLDFAAQTLRVLPGGRPVPEGAVVPLRWRAGALRLRLRVNGAPPEWGRLDTGCASALEWVVPGPRPRNCFRRISIGLAKVPILSGPATVQIGPWRFEQVPTGLHERPLFPGEAGLVGNGLLSRFRLTIDAVGGRLILAQGNGRRGNPRPSAHGSRGGVERVIPRGVAGPRDWSDPKPGRRCVKR